ncbi:MAG: hypothetical protein WCO90_03415 [Planctomycetota bacterium]
MPVLLWWETLLGTADLPEQAAAPAKARSMRSARLWYLLLGGIKNFDVVELRLAVWLVSLAFLPVHGLLKWLFMLRPLALASDTLRRPPTSVWEMPA